MKRHHPDAGAASDFDERRVREANAAYSHLRARAAAASGAISRRRHVPAPPRAVWDALWTVPLWPAWMPGVRTASAVTGACDRRVSLSARWNGHRISGMLVLMTAMPPCRLAGRVLDLRIDGVTVDGHPPRVWARVQDAPGGASLELGVASAGGEPLPPVIAAALDHALVELAELA
jgi:hypothetical protein